MGKHRKSRKARSRTPAKLNRALRRRRPRGRRRWLRPALSLVADGHVPTTPATTAGGSVSGNNTPIGNNGNGTASQNGAFNGNIMNNQLNAAQPDHRRHGGQRRRRHRRCREPARPPTLGYASTAVPGSRQRRLGVESEPWAAPAARRHRGRG